MKKLLVISGKGGTGKTTVSSAFIRFAEAQAFADCDVDAPNLHLLQSFEEEPSVSGYYGGKKARIEADLCSGCGACQARCAFGAIALSGGKAAVDPLSCEGCGVCAWVCPAGAVRLEDNLSGRLSLYRGKAVFSTASLVMGEGSSGKLVSEVKARLFKAAPPAAPLAVIDGSPGIGCPVIASLSGVDLALVVTEPSLSGLGDLERVLGTAAIFEVPCAVCVNKSGLCPEQGDRIEDFCKANGIPFAGRIRYDRKALEAVNRGLSVAEVDCPMRNDLLSVWNRVRTLLFKE